jgi:hypothetical protein
MFFRSATVVSLARFDLVVIRLHEIHHQSVRQYPLRSDPDAVLVSPLSTDRRSRIIQIGVVRFIESHIVQKLGDTLI